MSLAAGIARGPGLGQPCGHTCTKRLGQSRDGPRQARRHAGRCGRARNKQSRGARAPTCSSMICSRGKASSQADSGVV